jgi:hypothetical protein
MGKGGGFEKLTVNWNAVFPAFPSLRLGPGASVTVGTPATLAQ